jgi:hypothetical protein
MARVELDEWIGELPLLHESTCNAERLGIVRDGVTWIVLNPVTRQAGDKVQETQHNPKMRRQTGTRLIDVISTNVPELLRTLFRGVSYCHAFSPQIVRQARINPALRIWPEQLVNGQSRILDRRNKH